MPAKKPITLITQNYTTEERSKRESAESAMEPKTKLTISIPAQLKGRKRAAATWKRLIGLYLEIEGVIATAFDVDLLVKYCLLEDECVELESMRKTMKADWESNQKTVKKIKPTAETFKDYINLWNVVNGMYQRFQGMDARLDGKRKLLLAISQSLYLTPRSRAGVAPPEKPTEKPKSKMGNLLDED